MIKNIFRIITVMNKAIIIGMNNMIMNHEQDDYPFQVVASILFLVGLVAGGGASAW